ncbi:MAG: sulfotransferase [Myxococcota bacterium]
MSLFSALFGRKPQGEPVIVVSGLPRSGTSMMMKMLEAGGLAPLTDGVRTADVDNPKGYYEYERVKDLEKETDKSYVRDARGKVLKVISFLLKDLPDDNDYRIVFMRRDLGEVLASQNKMLKHRGEQDDSDDAAMKDAYLSHLASVRIMSRKKENWQLLEVRYDETVASPRDTAAKLNDFLGGKLNVEAMVTAVDAELYRNRKDKLAKG